MRMYTKKMARVRDRAKHTADQLRKNAMQIDEDDLFPPSMLEKLWDNGYMTMTIPKEYGGQGMSLPESVIVVECLAKGSGTAALHVVLQALAVSAIHDFASQKKKKDWLEEIVDKRYALAFALSEPSPKEGAKPTVTTARKNKSDILIRGKKTFISGAREADLVVVFAVTNMKASLKKALTAFVVPAGTTGMLPGKEMPRSGLRGAPAVDLVFEGCRVKAANRLGAQGNGHAVAQKSILNTLPLVSALACGLLEEAISEILRNVRQGGAGQSALSDFQPIELCLSDMSSGLDSARAMAWFAASALSQGQPESERLARESKWTATEAAVKGIDLASQMMGISGSVKGSVLERLSRDARSLQLVLGANHIHRTEVARKLIKGK